MFYNYPTHIFRSHQKSFGDIGKHGDTAGDGCHSLLQQVKTRVEYKNRNNTLAQRRRERRPRTGMAGEARLARGPVDQYGYVAICMWQYTCKVCQYLFESIVYDHE